MQGSVIANEVLASQEFFEGLFTCVSLQSHKAMVERHSWLNVNVGSTYTSAAHLPLLIV